MKNNVDYNQENTQFVELKGNMNQNMNQNMHPNLHPNLQPRMSVNINREKIKKKYGHITDDFANIVKRAKGKSRRPGVMDNQENSELSSGIVYAKYVNSYKKRTKSTSNNSIEAATGSPNRGANLKEKKTKVKNEDNKSNTSNISNVSNASNMSNISLDSSCSIELNNHLNEEKFLDMKKEGSMKFLKNPTKKRMNKLKKIVEILEYSIYNEEKKGSKLESKLYDYVLLTRSLRQEITNLEELNNSNKTKMASYEKDITKLKEQNEEMKLTLSTFENELSNLINKFDKNFAKELIDTKSQNDVLKKEVERLKMEIEKKNNEIKKIENWNDMSKKFSAENVVMHSSGGGATTVLGASSSNTNIPGGTLNNTNVTKVMNAGNAPTTGNGMQALNDKKDQGKEPDGNDHEKNKEFVTSYEFPFYYGKSEEIDQTVLDDLIVKMKTVRITYEKNIEKYDDDTKATIYGCYISNFILENKDICNHKKILKHLQEFCVVESKILNVHLCLRKERCDNVPVKELEKEVIRQLENPDSDKNKERISVINSIMLTLLFKNMHIYNLYRIFFTCLKCDNFRWIRLIKKSIFLKFFDLCLIDMNTSVNNDISNLMDGNPIHASLGLYNTVNSNSYGTLHLNPSASQNIEQIQYNIKHPMFYCSNETLKRLTSSMFLNFSKDPINPQNGDNIYHYLLQKKNFDLVKLLKLSGKNYNYIFNKNAENKTPLDYVDNEEIKIDLISGYILDIAGKGAENYKNAKYDMAFNLYSEALEKQIKLSESVKMGKSMNENIGKLYYNRARTLMHLNKWIDVVENCNNCLKYIPKYINAFDTQIHAYENLLEYENALLTYKNMCIKCNIKPDDKEDKLKSQINATSFQILNVNRNCSVAEIKQAFSNLSKKWHPDKLGINISPDIKKRHSNHFKRLFKAKQLLMNDAERLKEKKKKETNYVYPQIIEDANHAGTNNNSKPTTSQNDQKGPNQDITSQSSTKRENNATTSTTSSSPAAAPAATGTGTTTVTNDTTHKDDKRRDAAEIPISSKSGTFKCGNHTSSFTKRMGRYTNGEKMANNENENEVKNNFYNSYKDDIDKFQEKLKNFSKGLNTESEGNKNANPFLNLFDGKLTNMKNEKVDENFYKKLKEEYEGYTDDELTNFKTKISNSINNLIQTELNLKREYQELCIKEKTNVIMNARLCILQEIQKALCVRLDKERKLKVVDSIIKGRSDEVSASWSKTENENPMGDGNQTGDGNTNRNGNISGSTASGGSTYVKNHANEDDLHENEKGAYKSGKSSVYTDMQEEGEKEDEKEKEKEKENKKKSLPKFAKATIEHEDKSEKSRRSSTDNSSCYSEETEFFRDSKVNNKGDNRYTTLEQRKQQSEGGNYREEIQDDDKEHGTNRNEDKTEYEKSHQQEVAREKNMEQKMDDNNTKALFYKDESEYYEDNKRGKYKEATDSSNEKNKNKKISNISNNDCAGDNNMENGNREKKKKKKKNTDFKDINNMQWKEHESNENSPKKNYNTKLTTDHENFMFCDEKSNIQHEGNDIHDTFEFIEKDQGKNQRKCEGNNFFENLIENQSNQSFRHSNDIPVENNKLNGCENNFNENKLGNNNFFSQNNGNNIKKNQNIPNDSFYDGNNDNPNGFEDKDVRTKEETEEEGEADANNQHFEKLVNERSSLNFIHSNNYYQELESRNAGNGNGNSTGDNNKKGNVLNHIDHYTEKRETNNVNYSGNVKNSSNMQKSIFTNEEPIFSKKFSRDGKTEPYSNEEDEYNYLRGRMKDFASIGSTNYTNENKERRNGNTATKEVNIRRDDNVIADHINGSDCSSVISDREEEEEEQEEKRLNPMEKMSNNNVPSISEHNSGMQYSSNFRMDHFSDNNSDNDFFRNNAHEMMNQRHSQCLGSKHISEQVIEHKEEEYNINDEERNIVISSNSLKKEEQFSAMIFPGSNSYIHKNVDKNMFNMNINNVGSSCSGNLKTSCRENFLQKNLIYSDDTLGKEKKRTSFKGGEGAKYASDSEEMINNEKIYRLYNSNMGNHSGRNSRSNSGSNGGNNGGNNIDNCNVSKLNNMKQSFFNQSIVPPHDAASISRKNGSRNAMQKDNNNSEVFANFTNDQYHQEEKHHQSQPHQSQPHQSQPHQSQPHQSQPHQSQPHQSQPHQSQPHQSQPHQSQPHQSQPHQSQPHQSQPHQSQPHQSQPHQSQPHQSQHHYLQHNHTQYAYTNAEGGSFYMNSDNATHYSSNERHEKHNQLDEGAVINGSNNENDKIFFNTDLYANQSNSNNPYEKNLDNPFSEQLNMKQDNFFYDNDNFPYNSGNYYGNQLNKSYNYENVKLRNSFIYINENEEKNQNVKKMFSNDVITAPVSIDKEFNQKNKSAFNNDVDKHKFKNIRGKVPNDGNDLIKLKKSSLDKVNSKIDVNKTRSTGVEPFGASTPKKNFKKNINTDDTYKTADHTKKGKPKAKDNSSNKR